MKLVYLDTNILLAPLRHDDPNYEYAQKIISLKHIRFITGTITLVEIASVMSRESELVRSFFIKFLNDNFEETKSIAEENQISLIIDFLINLFNLEIMEEGSIEKLLVLGKYIQLPSILSHAISYAPLAQLRTLDLLHLSIVLFHLNFHGLQIDYLVTSDLDFLKKRDSIQRLSKLVIISLKSFIELES